MIGTSLGHYRILERLGKGGMGEVFVAEDTKLHRRVALKVLPEKFASSSSRRERFEREARAIAALDHPNIVTIFSVEESNGVHFITMQLLDGELLSERVPPHGLSLSDFLDVALPLSAALAAAHEKGIIHRDIKPKNIVITAKGTVKVLDFGLAKLDQPLMPEESVEQETMELTQPGMIMGTASYMSPEQLQGEAIDTRSDLFSLGVVLYQMATGRRPFRGRTAIAVASSILRDKPPAVTEIRKDLPRELASILERCLEVESENRYQSAGELHDDLEELRRLTDSGLSILTELTRAVTATRPRKRAAALLVLLLALVTAAGLWFGGVLGDRGSGVAAVRGGPVRIAVLPLENLGPPEEEYFAAGITDEITSRLASVSGLQVASRTSAMQFRENRPSAREIGEALGVDYILVGTVRWAGLGGADSQVRITPKLVRIEDDTQIWAQPHTFAIDDIFSVQTQIAESVVSKLGATLLEPERATLRAQSTDDIEAYKAYLEGHYLISRPDYTLESWQAATEAFERAVELDPEFAVAWAELAIAEASIDFHWLAPSEERKVAAKTAVDRARELDPDGSATHLALANYHYMIERDYDRALHELARAQADRSLEAEVLKTRGYIQRRQGSWPEAIASLEAALAIDRQDPTAAAEVAETYEVVRDFDNSLRNYQRSIALDPEQTYSYHSAARAHWTLRGSLGAARRLMEQMPESNEVAPVLFWMWQEMFEGDFDAALERLALSGVDTFEYWDGFWPRSLLEAQIHDLAGDRARARSSYEQARQTLETEVSLNDWDPRRHSALGLAYAGLGRAEEATREGRRAVELYPVAEDAYSGPTFAIELALILTRIGALDEAIDELHNLLEIPAVISLQLLELDPRWANLRDHPRFGELQDSYR